MNQIKNIKEVTEPLKDEILKGDVHAIEEMKAWLQAFGYSDATKDPTLNPRYEAIFKMNHIIHQP